VTGSGLGAAASCFVAGVLVMVASPPVSVNVYALTRSERIALRDAGHVLLRGRVPGAVEPARRITRYDLCSPLRTLITPAICESPLESIRVPAAGVSAGQGVISSVALPLMRRRVNAALDKWR
jgi:hypothetical protein